MAQRNSAKKIAVSDRQMDRIQVNGLTIELTDVMTGGRDQGRYLYYQLHMSMKKADRVDIIVSFLMES